MTRNSITVLQVLVKQEIFNLNEYGIGKEQIVELEEAYKELEGLILESIPH